MLDRSRSWPSPYHHTPIARHIFVWLLLLLTASLVSPLAARAQLIYPNDDVYVETSTSGTTTTTYDAYIASSQIVFGLGAANSVTSGRRRSYLEFTLGTNPVSSAQLRLYNYWGPNMGGGEIRPSAALFVCAGPPPALRFSSPNRPQVQSPRLLRRTKPTL